MILEELIEPGVHRIFGLIRNGNNAFIGPLAGEIQHVAKEHEWLGVVNMIDVVGLWDENQWVVGKVLVPYLSSSIGKVFEYGVDISLLLGCSVDAK